MEMGRKRKSESFEEGFDSRQGFEKEDLDLIKKLRAKRKADLEELDRQEEDN